LEGSFGKKVKKQLFVNNIKQLLLNPQTRYLSFSITVLFQRVKAKWSHQKVLIFARPPKKEGGLSFWLYKAAPVLYKKHPESETLPHWI